MNPSPVQQVEAYVAPLLRTLEALGWISRHLHPIGYSHILRDAGLLEDGAFCDDLRTARAAPEWSPPYAALRPQLDAAADLTLSAVDGLREAAAPPEDMQRAFRAFRDFPRALETLYPLAAILPPVNRFFLDPAQRDNADLSRRLMQQPSPDDTGVICFEGDTSNPRGAMWLYIPETYDPGTPAPVVFALHGGSGNGRAFLWSWVRAARSRGAIVVAPTSVGHTWAIQGDDRDSPRLHWMLNLLRKQCVIDPTRILLTGMSDGGTFTYTSGLMSGSPFTHLAPVAAAFHPMLVAMADADRMNALPIHILHGDKDWMFPHQMAADAAQHLTKAGANVTYRPITDLSHTYGADLSTLILDWLLA